MATIKLVTQRDLNQANVTGGTEKLVENGRTLFHGAADTLQLPLNAEIGFSFPVVASAAAIVTLAAQSGETLEGNADTAAAVGSGLLVTKRTATVWNSAFLTGGAAVA